MRCTQFVKRIRIMKNVLAQAFSCVRRLQNARPSLSSTSFRRRVRPDLESLEKRALLSAFTVTNNTDSGAGSLRQAILGSNAALGTTNTITFAIPGSGSETIDLGSPLPAITNSVAIEGTSQPGYTTTPLIVLEDVTAGSNPILVISAPGVSIRGLEIDNAAIAIFDDGRVIATDGDVPVQNFGGSAGNAGEIFVQKIANWIGATSGSYVLTEKLDPRLETCSLTVSWTGPPQPVVPFSATFSDQGFRLSPLGEVSGSATDLITSFGTTSTVAGPSVGGADSTAAPASSAPLGSALLASFQPGQSIGFGQSLRIDAFGDSGGDDSVADPRPSSSAGTTGGSGTIANQVAPWAPFAAGLDEGWQHLRARFTNIERSIPNPQTEANAAVSGGTGLQTQAPSSANARTGSNASRTSTRKGPDEGTGQKSVDDVAQSGGTAAQGTGTQMSVVGMNLSNPTGIDPTETVRDAALDDLDGSSAQDEVVVETEFPTVVDHAESQTAPVLAIAAASLTLSVTWKPAIVASRATSRARRGRL